MFLIKITYTKSLDIIDKFVAAHRVFLDEAYQKNYFIVSGPQNPRVGGILLSQLKDRNQLEAIINQDPYRLNNVAEYEIIEFVPVKYHKDFEKFMYDGT